jgi:hypothetical protein
MPDFDNDANGWSRRGFGPGPGDAKFAIEAGNIFGISVTTLAPKVNSNGAVSIDLLRAGKAPERIWEFYARRGRVSRTEYWHAFEDRK